MDLYEKMTVYGSDGLLNYAQALLTKQSDLRKRETLEPEVDTFKRIRTLVQKYKEANHEKRRDVLILMQAISAQKMKFVKFCTNLRNIDIFNHIERIFLRDHTQQVFTLIDNS